MAVSTNTECLLGWAFIQHLLEGTRKKKRSQNTLPHGTAQSRIFLSFWLSKGHIQQVTEVFGYLEVCKYTNEVNGITPMLRVNHVLCWMRATDLSNSLGWAWAVNKGYLKIAIICPDIAIQDPFCSEHVLLPSSVCYFTLQLRFLLCYSWQVRPSYLLTCIIWYTFSQKTIKIHIQRVIHCIFNLFGHSLTALANKWQALNSK